MAAYGRVDEERAVALVGLGDEQVAAAVVRRWRRSRSRSPPIGVRRVGAAAQQRDGQQRGGRGLAVGAGDGDARGGPAITDAERGRARQQPQARGAGLDDLGVVLADRGRDDDGVGVARPARRRGRRAPGRRARAARRGSATSLASLPLTGMPRASMIRAMPDSAGAADADEVHPAEPVGRAAARRGRGPSRAARAASSTIRASFSSASRGISAGGGRAHRGQPVGVGEQAGHGRGDPLRGERGVVDQQPAAGVDDRAGVERLLAVADRQRHEHRRQPDARPPR